MNLAAIEEHQYLLEEQIRNRQDDEPRLQHIFVDWNPGVSDPINTKFTAIACFGVASNEDSSLSSIPDFEPLPGIQLRPEFWTAMWTDSPRHRYRADRCSRHWVTSSDGMVDEILRQWDYQAKWMQMAGDMLNSLPNTLVEPITLGIADSIERWLIGLHGILRPTRHALDELMQINKAPQLQGGFGIRDIAFSEVAVSAAKLDDLLNDSAIALGILLEAAKQSNEAAENKPTKSRKVKRSTVRGEARLKLIAALTKHHKYADGSCLIQDPIGNNQLARLANVDKSSSSVFFQREFGSHKKYILACQNKALLLRGVLKKLNEDFSPYLLYGAKPPGEDPLRGR